MKHIKAISCLLLSTMVLTAFFGCYGSREESGVSDAMSCTQSVVSEAVSDVSAEESHGSSEEISMESFGEESGVMSGAEESRRKSHQGKSLRRKNFPRRNIRESSFPNTSKTPRITHIYITERKGTECMCLQSTTEPTNTYVFRQSTRENRLLLSAILRQAIFRSATISRA